MNQDINDIIAKNLPAQVGEILQKRLKDADKSESDLAAANRAIVAKNEIIAASEKEIVALKKAAEAHGDLVKREACIKEKERLLENEILKVKLQNAIETNNALTQMFGIVFKNPVSQETVIKSVSVPVDGHNGCAGYVTSCNDSETKTKTIV